MALSKWVRACRARHTAEGELLQSLLTSLGIGAKLASDGLEIWIEQRDSQRAGLILDAYLQERPKLAAAAAPQPSTSGTIEVHCEDCGQRSSYPATRRGYVEDCRHCGMPVDVGDEDDFAEPDPEPADEDDADDDPAEPASA